MKISFLQRSQKRLNFATQYFEFTIRLIFDLFLNDDFSF